MKERGLLPVLALLMLLLLSLLQAVGFSPIAAARDRGPMGGRRAQGRDFADTPVPAWGATETPQPRPTPLPLAASELAVGLKHQSNGDYERAITAYRAVIAAGSRSDEAAEARFHLGEVYLAQEAYHPAAAALRAVLAHRSAASSHPEAYFLLGTAYENIGETPQAISAYETYRESRPILKDYVSLRMARAYAAGGRHRQAIAAYEEVLGVEGVAAASAYQAVDGTARAYLELGQTDPAVVWFERALSLTEQEDQQAEVIFAIASVYEEDGQVDRAQAWFRRLVDELPRQPQAYYAVGALDRLGAAVNDYQRGTIYYYGRDYPAAIQALQRHVEADADHPDDAHYLSGRAYQRLDRHQEAVEEFDHLIDTHAGSSLLGEAWLAKARSLRASEGPKAAVDAYQRFAVRHPDNGRAAQALWAAADLLQEGGEHADAAETYLTLSDLYPSYDRSNEARFRAGLAQYRRGLYKEAEKIWRPLTESGHRSRRAQALFWTGMASLQAGEEAAGQERLTEVIGAAPGSYYALRAALNAGVRRAAGDEEGEEGRAAFEAWLRGWAEVPTDWEELDAELQAERFFQRGEAYLALNLYDEAAAEFTRVRDKYEAEPAGLYRLALLFADRGLHHLSISCAMRVAWRSPEGEIQKTPRHLQRLAYPRPYSDVITAAAEAFDLDPHFLYALIRQESWFYARAGSSAGALGLTQVIPPTGEWIAAALNRSDFAPEDLYRPVVSVEFGAWYLTQQLEAFDGERAYALAAYNGGPTRVKRWRQGVDSPELFVEVIDVAETRRFVQRIYEQYVRYEVLYGSH